MCTGDVLRQKSLQLIPKLVWNKTDRQASDISKKKVEKGAEDSKRPRFKYTAA